MDVRGRLMAAAAGLQFVTESESPVQYVSAPVTPAPASARDVNAALVEKAFGETGFAREDSVDHFFSGHMDAADPADAVAQANVPKFRALVAELKAAVESPRVYCFGEVEKRCYAVGRMEGGIAGVVVTAYES
jgi:hypothetical protein